jgi:hypothetical protein
VVDPSLSLALGPWRVDGDLWAVATTIDNAELVVIHSIHKTRRIVEYAIRWLDIKYIFLQRERDTNEGFFGSPHPTHPFTPNSF